MSVTLATHCHSRDLERLHAPGVLEKLIDNHAYSFDEILVVHQRCGKAPYALPTPNDNQPDIRVIAIEKKDYPYLLGEFGIPYDDPTFNRLTHGWDGPHYYAHHCVNHCTEILEANSDFIVFTDADCTIKTQPEGESWIDKAMTLLKHHPEIFIVSPSDGGHEYNARLQDGTRLTRTVSQQLFMGRRRDLREMHFGDLPWDGEFSAPYGPFQEFYGMFEGHMWRWIEHKNLYRAVLPPEYRYWHGEWH